MYVIVYLRMYECNSVCMCDSVCVPLFVYVILCEKFCVNNIEISNIITNVINSEGFALYKN